MWARAALAVVRRLSGGPPKGADYQRSKFRSRWDSLFGKYLLTTNIVTSGGLMAMGDIIQQEIEYQRELQPKRYDYGRLTRMFLVGLIYGPLHHYGYGWLQKVLPRRNLKTVVMKIGVDQFIISPVCIVTFFYGMGLLETKPLADINEELTTKFIDVYLMDWSVWPPTQFINFYFLPVRYQVLYINAVTMFYNVFLSYIKHREVAQAHKVKSSL